MANNKNINIKIFIPVVIGGDLIDINNLNFRNILVSKVSFKDLFVFYTKNKTPYSKTFLYTAFLK